MGTNQSYKEGDWFTIPLREGGYAVRLIARSRHKKQTQFEYFFGSKRDLAPDVAQLYELTKEDAILIGRFSMLGLAEGRWKVIGRFNVWDRQAWDMPEFVRSDLISGTHYVTRYSEDNLNVRLTERIAISEEGLKLPYDSLMGSGAVEMRLTYLLQ
jgi:Immunity protein 26